MNSNITPNKNYNKQQLKGKFLNLMGEAYEGIPDDPNEIIDAPELLLMSKADVLMLKLYQTAIRKTDPNNLAALKLILEYTIGKPKQEVETTKMVMTYQDFLNEINRSTRELIQEPTKNITPISKGDL